MINRVVVSIRKYWFAYALLSPTIICLAAFMLYPLAAGCWLSFTDKILMKKEILFIGLQNYKELLFKDVVFWKVAWNTIIWASLGTIGTTVIGLLLALLLYQKVSSPEYMPIPSC